ncbi:cholesterol esterase [Kappamyces sp. JEL0680]|nr:cholesterol esterase [Kappamyces sp. JEL0680]
MTLFDDLGLEHETFQVKTADFWNLKLFRISQPKGNRVVVLWHGLSTSSDIFICSDRQDSLASWLYDRGFDVWLANSRGNRYTHHDTLQQSHSSFWDFSLDEGVKDVVAVVDFVLKPSKWESSLHTLVDRISPMGLTWVVGNKSFIPLASVVSEKGHPALTRAIIKGIMQTFLGWRLDKYGSYDRQLKLYRNIFGLTSVRSFIHWFQIVQDKRFQMFDDRHRNVFCTQFKPTTPPLKFPSHHITTKVSLYCGDDDNLSDVEYMRTHIAHAKIVQVPNYEHLDLIWAHNAPSVVWENVIRDLNGLGGNRAAGGSADVPVKAVQRLDADSLVDQTDRIAGFQTVPLHVPVAAESL